RASITVVRAGAYLVEAGSAVFLLRVAARRTELWVQRGAVRVRGPAGDSEVAAGGSWSSEGSAAPLEASERELAERAAGQPLAALAPPAPASAPQVIPVSPPEVVRPPPPPRKRLLARAPKAEPAPLPVESDDELHARAVSLERQGRYADSAALYAELAGRSGPRAEPALYELARLRQRFLHEPRAALDALAEYQRRFPRGALARKKRRDRKSTRLNSSHVKISYAVFCLKKKNKKP